MDIMSRIYHIKNKIPAVVKQFFDTKYPGKEFSFDFYWYGKKDDKTYGCFVYRNGELYSYFYQGNKEDFQNMEVR